MTHMPLEDLLLALFRRCRTVAACMWLSYAASPIVDLPGRFVEKLRAARKDLRTVIMIVQPRK